MSAARRLAVAWIAAFLAAGCGHDQASGSGVNPQGGGGTFGGFAGTTGVLPGAAGTTGVTAPPGGSAGVGATAGPTAGGGTTPAAGGGPTAGTGATSGGTAGMTAGGAAGGGAPTSGGGYLVSGGWMGYAWTGTTGTGSMIMPKDFTGLAAGAPLCVMGTVEASADYSAVGMLGVNLNQASTPMAPLMTVTPKGTGLMVDIKNNGSMVLRVQIQAPDGDMVPEHRWCAPVSGNGGMIPWTTFNTKCWDNSGTAYAMEPISTFIVSVPSTMANPTPFNFCLNSVGEAGATSTTPPAAGSGAAGGGGGAAGMGMMSSGNPGMGGGTLTGQYDWHDVMKDGKNYIVQNNVWGGGGSQTVEYLGTTFTVSNHTGTNPTTGAPGSYPSVFIGSNNGHTTAGSGLPKQVSALGSVQTSWSHNAGSSIAGQYNAAYDVWFSTGSGGDPGAPSGGYLMVWLYKSDQAVRPLGNTIAQSGATIAGVEGSWDVWIGQQMGKPCISYVRTQTLNTIKYDLNAFIQDAVKRAEKPIQASWYLTNVFAGFEIWSGGNGLKTTEFSAAVQ